LLKTHDNNPNYFPTLSSFECGMITYGDDGASKIVGIETIGKSSSPIEYFACQWFESQSY